MIAKASIFTIAKLVAELTALAFFVLLSRFYGSSGVGVFTFSMAVGGYFLVFSQGGLYSFTLRDVTRSLDKTDLIKNILLARSLLIGLSLIVLSLVSYVLSDEIISVYVIFLIGLYCILLGLVSGISAIYVGDGKVLLGGGLEALIRILAVSFAGLLIWLGFELEVIFSSLVAVLTIGSVVFLFGVFKRYNIDKFRVDVGALIDTLRKGLPFLLAGIYRQTTQRLDFVVLGFVASIELVGQYGMAQRIMQAFALTAYFVSNSVLPETKNLQLRSSNEMKIINTLSFITVAILVMPLGAVALIHTSDLIDLIYGEGYKETIMVMKAFAMLLVIIPLRECSTTLMLGIGQEKEWSKTWRNTAFLSVGIVPLSGYFLELYGIVFALVFLESLLLAQMLLKLRATIRWSQLLVQVFISIITLGLIKITVDALGLNGMFLMTLAAEAGLYMLFMLGFWFLYLRNRMLKLR